MNICCCKLLLVVLVYTVTYTYSGMHMGRQQSIALQELGADEVIDYREQSVDQVFKDNPFDAVVDQIGGES